MYIKIKNILNDTSLTVKLALTFFLITLITSSAVGLISYQLSSRIITKSSIKNATTATSSVISSIRTFFKAADQTVINIYSNKNLHNFLNRSANELPERNDYYFPIDTIITSAKALNDSIAFVNIYGINGFSYTDPYYRDENFRDYASSVDYYSSIGLSRDIATALWLSNQKFSIETSKKNVLVNVRYIRNVYNYNITGIIITGIKESSLYKQYISTGSSPFIVDKHGVIVSHQDKTSLGSIWKQPSVFSKIEKNIKSGTVTFYNNNLNKQLFSTFSYIEPTGWYFINIEDYYEVFRNNYSLLYSVLFILFLSLAISFLIVFYISKRLTLSVNQLFFTMNQAKIGNLDVRFRGKGSDEINRIGNYLNQMLDQIQENITYKTAAEKLRRTSEMHLLQSQINPHLLYNTLDSVHYHLETGKFQEASILLKSMSQFFKIALSKGNFIIPIAQEIEQIKSYLEIQRICREKDISLHLNGDLSFLQFEIPKTTLQPIVENSIIHGFEGNFSKGNITINLAKLENFLLITVTDDGIGLTDEQIIYLNSEINQTEHSYQRKSYGLWNVNQRISHCFGNNSYIYVSGEFGEFTRTTIKIYLTEEQCNV